MNNLHSLLQGLVNFFKLNMVFDCLPYRNVTYQLAFVFYTDAVLSTDQL